MYFVYDFRDKIYGRFHSVFMIAAMIVAAIVLMYILRGIMSLKAGRKTAPRVTKAVKIVSKRKEALQFATPDGAAEMSSTVNYYVTYLVDEKEIELAVPKDVYEESISGNEGYLMYRGKTYLAFKTKY